MISSKTKKAVKQWVTFILMGVTVLLWGYLIGTFIINVRQSSLEQQAGNTTVMAMNSGVTASSIPQLQGLFGRLPGLLHAPMVPPNMSLPQHNLNLAQPTLPDEAVTLGNDHRRFAERDKRFEMRLKQDAKFLLENSF